MSKRLFEKLGYRVIASEAKQSDAQGHGEAKPWPSLRLLRPCGLATTASDCFVACGSSQ
jgi:hypothetical protein